MVACREKVPSALYFKYNTQLGPPYQVIVDTNFINFSIRNKVCYEGEFSTLSLTLLPVCTIRG